jgi:hypothetical protein
VPPLADGMGSAEAHPRMVRAVAESGLVVLGILLLNPPGARHGVAHLGMFGRSLPAWVNGSRADPARADILLASGLANALQRRSYGAAAQRRYPSSR